MFPKFKLKLRISAAGVEIACLRRGFDCRFLAATRVPTIHGVVSCVSWEKAFVADGAGASQRAMSSQVKAELGVIEAAAWPWPDMAPRAEAVACIFPSRLKVDRLSYVLWEPQSHRKHRAKPSDHSRGAASASPTVFSALLFQRRVLPATLQAAKQSLTVRRLDWLEQSTTA